MAENPGVWAIFLYYDAEGIYEARLRKAENTTVCMSTFH